MKKPPIAGMNLAGTELGRVLSGYVEPAWYLDRYADVAAEGFDPVWHFLHQGAAEGRDPNRFFDAAWYRQRYPDVGTTLPLLHYLLSGAAQGRDPHPRFDTAYYAKEHPEAAGNPLLFHLRVGHARGYATERPFPIADYLPSRLAALPIPDGVTVDVVIPVYRGFDDTRRCLDSVLADPSPPLGRVIVVEDRSPEAGLVAWLRALADAGRITLLRNRRNLGFVASVNRGMEKAGRNDVVLLNNDTQVPPGWLGRLAAHAHADARIASVSPFSNNATIRGYPGDASGTITLSHTLADIDDACRSANVGRSVPVPVTHASCMYIRRSALDDVGPFDAEGFGPGCGEEGDFCLRATEMGWSHRLACDMFVHHSGVHHSGHVGAQRQEPAAQAEAPLTERLPDYRQRIDAHEQAGKVTPYRFNVTAALFRASKHPVILMVSHELGGGIRRHIDSVIERATAKAHFLLLEGTPRHATLFVPALPDHPPLRLPSDQIGPLEALLRSMAVSRVHIHHLMKVGLDVRMLIQRLGVAFDVTVHDYYAICPQRNLLPWEEALYCREPGPATCNACIADTGDLVHGARDILSWRLERAWQLLDAERVICPSEDVRRRLETYGLAQRAVVVPHEVAPSGDWPVAVPKLPAKTALRVVLLGVLASLKGSRTVAAVASAVRRSKVALHLVGSADANFPDWARGLISQTGPYKEADLPALIRQADPHVFWFASTAPETYSYTLTAAIETGLPIVATRLGAFVERLRGRPLTWLVEDSASTEDILAVFADVRRTLEAAPVIPATPRPEPSPDFYARAYLAYPPPSRRKPAGRPKIAALPALLPNGSIAPASHERLLQPLEHPSVARDYQLVLGDPHFVATQEAAAIVLHPDAVRDRATAAGIIAHARRTGIRLAVDLHGAAASDDPVLDMLLGAADAVWAESPVLLDAHPRAALLPTRLDERLWLPSEAANPWSDPIRLLWSGSPSEAADLAMIEPVLLAMKQTYGYRIEIDILGLAPASDLPEGLTPVRPPAMALLAYPMFVHWLRLMAPGWHIGLAPKAADSRRSPVRALEYAALGLPVLASDVPAYRGSPADGVAGRLVPNTPEAWYAAIDGLICAQAARQALAARARPAFEAGFTLAEAGPSWHAALGNLLAEGASAAPALRRSGRDLHSAHELPGTASRSRSRRARG